MKGKFYGVGVGVGDKEELTLKAVRVLKSADVLVLPEAKKNEGSTAFEIVREYLGENTEKLFLEFPMLEDVKEKERSRKENADRIKEELEKGKNVVFLTIGDPMIFSTYTYILEYLGETHKVETVPGITSFGSMASKLNIPLVIGDEDLKIVSLNKDTDIHKEIENSTNIVFMKLSRNFERLKEALRDTGNLENSILISNCGKENEEIITDIDKAEKVHYFSTLILKKGGLKKWKKFIS
jgi:precorrin-2/cobalt-factor-2 C20-methyltransferase